MHWTFPRYMNIRQRVVVGLTLSMLLITSIGLLSFRYLREIERKQRFVEIADDLSNVVLEIRRYEKNYLLYRSQEDLDENDRYIQEGLQIITKVIPEVQDFKGAPQLSLLEKEFLTYQQLMARVPGRTPEGISPVSPQLEDQLRDSGKRLVDLSQRLVAFERERILIIISSLKTQLISSLLVFLTVGAFLIPMVSRKIIRPLKVIEKTTHRIAQGDFSPLAVRDTRDETQRVVEAFNRMITELEKRQDQLLQAKKLSSLGILTSGIAHQLNNPLNNISTSCQISLEELDQGDQAFLRKMLTNIEQEVHRARDIVRGLLEFSRVKEFALCQTPLTQVVERSVSLISSQVPPGIEIQREIPEGLCLNLDSQRMQQVFLNLLMNAIQAIPNPPGQVRVRAREEAADGHVVIEVEDTGTGIAEKDLGRVFDPFFTTKEVGIGTGLGLSIVYGIIQKHQGSIAVESRLGEGTRFVIRLPLALRG